MFPKGYNFHKYNIYHTPTESEKGRILLYIADHLTVNLGKI